MRESRRAKAVRRFGAALACVLGAGAGAAAAVERPDPVPGAILQGLDKTTARVSTIEAPIDGVARFGSLEITARACHKKPPTEPPESAAFLEIVDVRPDSPAVDVFSGWMFASSPALSAMEHPVYDVWVIDCRKVAAPAPVEEAPEPEPPQDALQVEPVQDPQVEPLQDIQVQPLQDIQVEPLQN